VGYSDSYSKFGQYLAGGGIISTYESRLYHRYRLEVSTDFSLNRSSETRVSHTQNAWTTSVENQSSGLARLVPCARLVLVLETAHVLTFRDCLESAALLSIFRLAGQALQIILPCHYSTADPATASFYPSLS
jgi:hypothetical protein